MSTVFKILPVTALAAWCQPSDVEAHAATSNTVLFDREIVRILNAHCVMCHMQAGVSSPLETYEQVWLQRQAVHDRILARHMPPWAAVPGYGEFANANGLTLREQRFIVSWVEGLGPRNDGSVFLNVFDAEADTQEPVRASADLDAWRLGEPDLEIALRAVEPSARVDRVQHAIIETGLSSATVIAAIEYLPSDRRSMHAAVFSVAETGQWLATWTPWHGFHQLPEPFAYRLPAGANIEVQIHAAEPISALGRIGLHVSSSIDGRTPVDLRLRATADTPAGQSRARLRAEAVLESNTEILALWPTLPNGTESIEVAALQPNGKVDVLLYALEIPVDWPTPYIYSTPVALPAGSRITLTAYVENLTGAWTSERVDLVISAVTE